MYKNLIKELHELVLLKFKHEDGTLNKYQLCKQAGINDMQVPILFNSEKSTTLRTFVKVVESLGKKLIIVDD